MLDIASLPEGLSAVRRLGVVADTHIPDRVRSLHPDLLPGLKAANAEVILHAGDICSPVVLAELSQVAPVVAVRGNRDWALPVHCRGRGHLLRAVFASPCSTVWATFGITGGTS